MSTSNNNFQIMFFLGAGASIDARLPGVIKLLHEFKKYLETNSKIEQLSTVNDILDVLKRFKSTKKDDSPVDIELLLEAVEKIENRYDDILMYFFKNEAIEIEKFKAYQTIFKGKDNFSSEIKRFIKKVFSDTQMNTQYLNPLNDFIKHYIPLCIFSTNYDICIEKFCQDNNRDLVDGFNPRWNPEREYVRPDVDVRLYKLHGSITWYRSEQGDYTRSDILIENDRATSIAGQQMVPLILYPGRKLEYVEPVIYLLVELEKQLRNRNMKYVFAIGYSFKDDHLAKLFQYAARKNPDLIVFLISPSAYNIYTKRLKYHKDRDFKKSFTTSFRHQSFTVPIPSKLCGRVICLNYELRKIFPLLEKNYLSNLIEAEKLENTVTYGETEAQRSGWKNRLRYYIDCEYMEKVESIIDSEVSWDKLVIDDWKFSFEISFKGLLHSLSSNNEASQNMWREYFRKVGEGFSIDKFSFIPHLGWTSTIPGHIELEFRRIGGNVISVSALAEYLDVTIIPFTENKLNILSASRYRRIKEFLDRIKILKDYLHSMLGDNMTYEIYYLMRGRHYRDKIRNLQEMVTPYLTSQNEARAEAISNMIKQIENKEILRMFGGDTLRDNFNSVTMLGYLSKYQ